MKAIDEALEKAEEQVARYTEAAKETKVSQFGLYLTSMLTMLWIRNVSLKRFFNDLQIRLLGLKLMLKTEAKALSFDWFN